MNIPAEKDMLDLVDEDGEIAHFELWSIARLFELSDDVMIRKDLYKL